MTPKISFVTVLAVALVAVPAAWGNQQQSNPRGMLASDAVESVREQAAQSFNPRDAMASDSVDAVLASERSRRATAYFYANDAKDAAPANRPEPVLTQSSGRDIEWTQIGMGFGLGIVLATRSLPGHALHADRAAGALIGSSHPQVPRPPSNGRSRRVRCLLRRVETTPKPYRRSYWRRGSERRRPPARAARSDRAAHPSADRSGAQDGKALVDTGLDRRRTRRALARRALRRSELGEERPRGRAGSSSRVAVGTSDWQSRSCRPRRRFRCSAATTSSVG